MRPAIELILACVGLSLSISYLWWVWWRVWIFRQDLFVIRDRLWDAVRAGGLLDDPAHRECRQDINAMIRLAPVLSLFTFLELFEFVEGESASRKSVVPEAVTEARTAVYLRTFHFLFLESFSGLAVLAVFATLGLGDMLRKYFYSGMEKFFVSKGVQAFARQVAYGRHDAAA